MKAKSESQVAQLCLTLSDPMDCSLQISKIKVPEDSRSDKPGLLPNL